MKLINATEYTKGFWLEAQLDPTRSDYNIVIDQRVKGHLDIERLNRAIKSFVLDHIIFNSHLEGDINNLYWVENISVAGLEYYLDKDIEYIKSWVAAPFDISSGALYRFGLFELESGVYDFIVVLHHALMGGAGGDYFIKKLSAYYSEPIPNLDINKQYEQINVRYSKISNKVAKVLDKEYWLKKLSGCNNIDLNRVSTNDYGIGEILFEIDSQVIDPKILSEYDVSLFNVLISLYGYILKVYSQQSEPIAILYPVAIKEALSMLYGGQVNTLVLPFDYDNDDSFADIFIKTKLFVDSLKSESIDYSYVPARDILRGIEYLSDISFAQTNFKTKKFEFDNLDVEIQNRFNFDIGGSSLSLQYQKLNDKVIFKCLYKKSVFSEEYVLQLSQDYKRLVIEILSKISSAKQKETDYSLLTKEDYQTKVYIGRSHV